MTVEEQIKEFISKNLIYSNNGFHYDDQDSFLAKGIVDSTGIMELVLFTEEKFGISVENSEITPTNFDSVAKLAAFVRRKKITL
jgi:acyl carrier protein